MSCRDVLPVQEWYTAAELAGFEGLPATQQGVGLRAKKEGWANKKREGRGGGKEYAFSSLPQVTQDAILERSLTVSGTGGELLDSDEPEESKERPLARYEDLNDDQIKIMSARVAFVREIQRLEKVTTQKKAILTLVANAKLGNLTQYLAERVVLANDRKTATRTLSERTLKRWLSDFREHGELGLVPRRRKKDMRTPPWGPDFLKFYQRPQKPSIAQAYREFVERTSGDHPSYDQVNRWLKRLPPEVREKGRRSGEELRAFQAFKRRKTDQLWPNSVWQSDGHTFDAEVLNPLTNRPFRPEVTLVEDWCTRRIVGFALNLAESTMATLDALRHSITNAGMFEILYVDNGPGYKNSIVREVVDRLGGTMTFSTPGAPQAHGAIERTHRTELVRLAKTFDSYIGADMDRRIANRRHTLSRRDIKKGLKPRHIPTFQEFFDRLSESVERYNNTPHSGLQQIRDLETGKLRFQTPMESWASFEAQGFEPQVADPELIQSLTRPQHVRTTARGEVQINRGKYFNQELVAFHGQEIKVAWDYRDSSSVGAFTLDGEFICEAELDGNATPAMPATVQEQAKEKRKKGQLKLAATKIKTRTGLDVEIRTLEPQTDSDDHVQRLIEAGRAKAKELAAPKEEKFQPPEGGMERYRLWQKLDKRVQEGEELKPDEKKWWETYPTRDQFRAIKRVMDASANGKTVSARRAM